MTHETPPQVSLDKEFIRGWNAAIDSATKNEWQPIETAPRDGTWCLYWDAEFEKVQIARRGQGAALQSKGRG